MAPAHLHATSAAVYMALLYKYLVYKNIKASKCPKIKNDVVFLLVTVSISFEDFKKKLMVLYKKRV